MSNPEVAAWNDGVAPATLRAQIRLGVLTAEKHGRDWYVTPAEVERYRIQHRRAVA